MLRHFLKNRSGNFAVSTAVLAVPLFAMVGLGLDYGRAILQRQAMQDAADAAVLAAVSSGKTRIDDLTEIANRFYNTNITQAGYPTGTTLKLTRDENNSVTVSVTDVTPLTLGAMFYPHGLKVGVSAQASRLNGGQLEIALVMDTTRSMTLWGSKGSRLQDLGLAVTNLVYYLKQADPDRTRIKLGLVPFAQYVNIGQSQLGQSWLQFQYMDKPGSWLPVPVPPGQPFSVTRNSCHRTTTCTWGFGITDGLTDYTRSCKQSGPTVCTPATTNYGWNGCVGSRPSPHDMTTQDVVRVPYPALANVACNQPVVPLTNDLNSVRTAAWQAVPAGETYVGTGILWGWNLLTPDPPFTEAAPMDANVRKIMIVMTDGGNTRAPSYPTHDDKDPDQSTSNMLSLCNNVKRDGITIYTVAFRVGSNTEALDALKACASSNELTFLSDNKLSLVDIFTAIALDVTAPRLTM